MSFGVFIEFHFYLIILIEKHLEVIVLEHSTIYPSVDEMGKNVPQLLSNKVYELFTFKRWAINTKSQRDFAMFLLTW